MIDLHTHTNFSPDSASTMEDIVLTCLNRGIEVVAFTDHMDYSSKDIDIENLNKTANALKQKYSGQIEVITGIEANYTREAVDDFASFLDAHTEIEYVINSVHEIDSVLLYSDDFIKGRPIERVYREYLERVNESLDAKYYFSTLGHFGFVCRYTRLGKTFEYDDFPALIDEILKKVIKKEIILEVNTSAGALPLPFLAPVSVLQRYKKLGGEFVTIGSDSHNLTTLGRNFSLACNCLKEIGFDKLTYIKQRKKNFKNI